MGEIGRKLAGMFDDCAKRFGVYRKGGPHLREHPDVKNIPQLVQEGHDPVHAAYVHTQNLVSFLSEKLTALDELDPFRDLYEPAEEEYMPGWPPMSPLSVSYFTTWGLLDLRFGKALETIATCILDASGPLGINPDDVELIRLFQRTRMGIYEHQGRQGGRVRLRELITGDEFDVYVPSGYQGEKSELWYTRLCPPPHDRTDYHVSFTSPYVLGECTKADWIAYLRKSMMEMKGTSGDREALYALMKYGRETNSWNEYIFLSYHHHQDNAIFLAGLPDVKGSLPHGHLAGGTIAGRR